MTTSLSSQSGWLLLASYGAIMTAIVWFKTSRDRSAEQHLVADRKVGIWPGAFSIAVTWIWAPAIFVCSQKAYEQGLAGIFWFTVPNIICFFTFVPVVLKARRLMPKSYSLPDFIWKHFGGDARSHLVFVAIVLGTSVTGIISNSLAGGLLLNSLAGTDKTLTIIAFSFIALFYSIWRGLPASIVTDVMQMALILAIALLLVPWTLFEAGGVSTIWQGLAGTQGSTNVLEPWILYSFGLPATIGLISGPICDQMFYQRAMATRPEYIKRTFVYGGLLFGIVPVVLSVFGFIAASPSFAPQMQGVDSQMVSIKVVEHLLPQWTLYGFAIMALCGLSSTLDSAYCAAGSLFAVDVYRRYLRPDADDQQLLWASKIGMLFLAVIGTSIAIIPGVQLLWIFLIYGTLAAAGLFPALLALFWSKTSARGVYWGAASAITVGLPIAIYANATNSPHLIVASSLCTCLIGLGITAGEAVGLFGVSPSPRNLRLELLSDA